jgi:3'-5' exonuclease
MANALPHYLVFDIESVADGALVSRLRYPADNLSPEKAIARYRGELQAETGKDFIPYTFQVPISLVIAKLGKDLALQDLVSLDEEESRPHEIASRFWEGWRRYNRPQLVSFNGRGFDMPLLELCAFRYGIQIPDWFAEDARSFEQPRNRYNLSAHLDLHEWLTNNGASRFNGGLSLAANLIGKPGKIDVAGHMVQDLWDSGKKAEIHDYCRGDVLDTYFVFLRSRVVAGDISLQREQDLIAQTKEWIEAHAGERAGLARYLNAWGDWQDPRDSAAS